jgi:hypothetical protein
MTELHETSPDGSLSLLEQQKQAELYIDRILSIVRGLPYFDQKALDEYISALSPAKFGDFSRRTNLDQHHNADGSIYYKPLAELQLPNGGTFYYSDIPNFDEEIPPEADTDTSRLFRVKSLILTGPKNDEIVPPNLIVLGTNHRYAYDSNTRQYIDGGLVDLKPIFPFNRLGFQIGWNGVELPRTLETSGMIPDMAEIFFGPPQTPSGTHEI